LRERLCLVFEFREAKLTFTGDEGGKVDFFRLDIIEGKFFLGKFLL
jgi:hypothetical protein